MSARRQRKLRYAVAEHTPAAFGLAGVVWTRKTVAELIRVRHGVVLSLRTVGNYLCSWGLSPQKPIRRAYEQDPEAEFRYQAMTIRLLLADLHPRKGEERNTSPHIIYDRLIR